MSGPYGPGCDEVIAQIERRAREESTQSYIGGLIIASLAWIALIAVLLVSGVWFWIALAGAICVWVSVVFVTVAAVGSR